MNHQIDSKVIKGFPISKRGEKFADAYLLKEKNLTETIRALFPYNDSSFIASADKTKGPFRFVIHGYYFETDDAAEKLAANFDKNLFAHIYVNDKTDILTGLEVKDDGTISQFLEDQADYFPGSSTSIFAAIYFSNTKEEPNITDKGKGNYNHYCLQLLDGGEICKESLLTYQTKASNLITDAGSITTSNLLTDLSLAVEEKYDRHVAHFTIEQGKDKQQNN